MIFFPSREQVRIVIRVVMSMSTLVLITFLCWWLSCAYNYALVSNNYNTNGLFPNGPITDIKDGSLTSLFAWVNQHSITLVVFYAPWSGQCIKMAPVFLAVHRRLRYPVLNMAAVNCWVGTCRDKFPTLHFPRVFLYHSTQLPLEYLGEIEVQEMLDFIRLSILPWTYIGSSYELQKYINDSDSYIIAYMDHERIESDKVYTTFYHSSLLMINKVNRPSIGMVTNKTIAGMLKLTEHGQIRSYPLQRFHTYTTQHNYTPEAISSWMVKQTRKLVHILKPQADQDVYLSALKKGPAAILYSSLSSMENHLLQEYLNIAVSYHRCHRTIRAKEEKRKSICRSYLVGDNDICSVCRLCLKHIACSEYASFFPKLQIRGSHIGQCFSAVSLFYRRYSVCCLSGRMDKAVTHSYLLVAQRRRMLSQVSILLKYMQERSTNRGSSMNRIHEANVNLSPMSMLLNRYNTLRDERRSICGNSSRVCPVDKWFTQQTTSLMEGMACRTNRSLNFFLLDYDKHKDVLKQVGTPHNPSLVIVDLEKDQHFKSPNRITATTMASFVLQFNLGLLQEKLITSDVEELKKNPPQPNSVRIVELTSRTFEEFVLKEEINVFVMFYSTWCGMCKATNLVFLKLVHSYEGKVLFARIDGDKHELPWHYKAPVYPSFLLYPAYRKTFSVSYPSHEDITVENLVEFLDHNTIDGTS